MTSLLSFYICHYSKSLSCLLFLSPPVISLVSTSHQILFDWCEHYFCHNISWNWYIDTMIKWNDYLFSLSRSIVETWCNNGCNLHWCQRYMWASSFWMTPKILYYFRTTHRCSFFSTYHSDYESTKPHSHYFTYQVQWKVINILYDTKFQPNLKSNLHVSVYDTKSTMKWNQFLGKMKACTKWTLFWGCC